MKLFRMIKKPSAESIAVTAGLAGQLYFLKKFNQKNDQIIAQAQTHSEASHSNSTSSKKQDDTGDDPIPYRVSPKP